ncbi:MAG: glycosyltransferase family 39 protein [Elusimicrobiaceae bacterium]
MDRKNLADYSLAVFAAALLSIPFFGTAPHEDLGYYAYVSKAVAAGFMPHRDIPLAQNTLGFYLNGAVFRLFGESVFVFRFIYFLFLAGFAVAFLKLAKRILKTRAAALSAVLIALVFVCQPQIQRGFGRNNFLPVLFFVTLGVYCSLFAEKRRTFFLSGLFAGFAAAYNESFLIYSFAPVAFALFYAGWRNALFALGGLVAAFAVPAGLLTYGQCWDQYFTNFYHLGIGARMFGAYSGRFDNLLFISWDLFFIYSGALILWRPWKFTALRQPAENRMNALYMPFLLFTVLFVNTVREYHLQAVTPFIVLTALSSAGIYYPDRRLKTARPLLWAASFFVFLNVPCLMYDYYAGLKSSAAYGSRYLFGWQVRVGERSARIADIINRLPHEKTCALAQFPSLFLDNTLSLSNPFIEDLTIAYNSGGYYGFHKLTPYLLAKPADIYIGKRNSDISSSGLGFLRRFLNGRYIMVADFCENSGDNFPRLRSKSFFAPKLVFFSRRYRDDIYYTRVAFEKYFRPMKTTVLKVGDFRQTAPHNYAVVLSVPAEFAVCEVRFSEGIKKAALTSGENTVRLTPQSLFKDRIYSALFAEDETVLSLTSGDPAFSAIVTYYTR